MNYNDLIGLWRKQSDLFERWKKDLLASAERLRTHLENALGAPTEKWEDPDSQKRYRYVELTDMFVEDSSDGGGSDDEGLSGKSMTKNMELVFGISIMLDLVGDKGNPSVFNLPVAIRYTDNELEYALFDPQKAASLAWEDNIDQFTESIFEKIEEYFSFNPYVGPRGELEVGFLKKH